MNEFTPLFYKGTTYKVPAVYKTDSPLYEGFHDAFWITTNELTADMEIRTRNFKNS